MPKRVFARFLLATLLLALALPTASSALPRVKDSNGVVVGTVRGVSNTIVRILYADGSYLVPLRVEKNDLVGPNIPHYTTANCTGTAYIQPSVMTIGINRLYNRAYVTGRESRLWRTKPPNATVNVDIESRYDVDQGGCVGWAAGPGTAPYVPAPKFVAALENDFPPPYTIVGSP